MLSVAADVKRRGSLSKVESASLPRRLPPTANTFTNVSSSSAPHVSSRLMPTLCASKTRTFTRRFSAAFTMSLACCAPRFTLIVSK